MKEKGGEILAVSTDSVERLSVGRKQMPDLPCLLISDANCRAIQTLNMVHHTMNKTVPIPSNILLDKSGRVAWAYYSSIVPDRPAPAEVLAQVQKLQG